MARIRSIKPEFWTSEQIMDCSPSARLAFIGMWNFCDDAGIHPASAKTLKAEVFPADDILVGDVQVLVDELMINGLIIEYEVAGKAYWQVTGWAHQKIEKPNYKHPKPETRQPFDDKSPTDRRPLDYHSTPERRGEEKESKGMDTSLSSGAHESENSTKPTRKGIVCGMLRKAGMADAAPHYLTEETWTAILAKRTDEEIIEVARAKMAAMPNQRIGLKYIAKALLDDPEHITANARASPTSRRQTISDDRKAASMILTGRKPENERPTANTERDITADCQRIA